MSHFYGKLFLLEFVLPVCLGMSVIIRQTGFSFIYLFYFLVHPAVKAPTLLAMSGTTRCYLLTLLIISTVILLAHCGFQIILALKLDVGEVAVKFLQNLGLVNLSKNAIVDSLLLITPDIMVFLCSLWVNVVCNKWSIHRREESSVYSATLYSLSRNKWVYTTIQCGKGLTLILLCIAGGLTPSILNAVYFLVFLVTMTWWACYRDLGYMFGMVLHCLQLFIAIHAFALLSFQTEFVLATLNPESKYIRYFGLNPLIKAKQEHSVVETIISDYVPAILNPIVLLVLYYIISLEANLILQFPRLTFSKNSELNLQMKRMLGERAASTESEILSTPSFQHPSETMVLQIKLKKPSVWSEVQHILKALFRQFMQSSYIFMNLTMMLWSITFHGYLTSIFMLWSTITWSLPKHRQTMMRSSPFVMFYGEFLLVMQYFYGMDIMDEVPELKSTKIGFVKVQKPVCIPIFIEAFYMILCWITVHQHLKEKFYESSGIDMSSISRLDLLSGQMFRQSRLARKAVKLVQHYLAKFWIWFVIIMFTVYGIFAKVIIITRIIFAVFLLVFIVTFQISNELWRKILYTYWRVLTFFCITVLLLLYAYQFSEVRSLWDMAGVPENVTRILITSEDVIHSRDRVGVKADAPPGQLNQATLQKRHTIGFVQYGTKTLLIKLAVPAFFLIICEIQLHYFHEKFLLLTDPEGYRAYKEAEEAKKTRHANETKSATPTDATEEEINLVKVKIKKSFSTLKDFVCLFLEIHTRKIMLITIMSVCTAEVSALHMIYVVMIAIALFFHRKIQMHILHFVLISVAFHIICNMTYQLDVFEHSNFNITCEDGVQNYIEWLGFYKKGKNEPLLVLLKGDVAIFIVSTLLAVLKVRQEFKRISKGLSPEPPRVMFPEITRVEADQNIRNCIKYLFNYGFYKLGVEICFITTVVLIGYHIALDSVFHTVWLLVMYNMPRKLLSKVWQYYTAYNMILTVIQYGMAVGFSSKSCSDYYILLILVCRQKGVFYIEKKYAFDYYPGGNNKSILKEIEKPWFVNPIHDHITNPRSWLDSLKSLLLTSFLWATICVVFLAGSDAIYAIGYFLFAYSFFWNLEDLYFYKMSKLRKVWNMLLAYTLGVILCKAILDVFGCFYIRELKRYVCWLVHMFAITCNKEIEVSNEHIAPDFDPRICTITKSSKGIVSDGLCFCFLLIMRRLFCSYYFLHHVNESKAKAQLASRGADMIEHLRQKRILLETKREEEALEQIKIRMERINARATIPIETDNHYVVSHSGDYYMFEEMYDANEFVQSIPTKTLKKDHTFFKVVETALKRDMSKAADLAFRRITSPQSQRQEPSFPFVPEKKPDEEVEEKKEDKVDATELYDIDEQPDTPDRTKATALLRNKLWIFLKFIWALIKSLVDTITIHLNTMSHDYCCTMEVLKYRRNIIVIKEAQERLKKAVVRSPSVMKQYKERLDELEKLLKQHQHDKAFTDAELLEMVHSADKSSAEGAKHEMQKEDHIFKKDEQGSFVKLFIAVKCAVLSHSDLLCYLMVFLYQLKKATILALPLPLMVLLWGTLSVPRPSRTFWIIMIAYTKAIVLVKWLFQFHVTYYGSMINDAPRNPLYPPTILGFGIHSEYQVFELVLLLVFFFHRSTLQSLGLWKASEEDPVVFKEKTEDFIVIDQGDSVLVIPAIPRKPISLYEVYNTSDSERFTSNATPNEVTALQRFWQENGARYSAYNRPEAIVANVYSTEALEHLPDYIFLVLQRYFSSVTQMFKNLFRQRGHLQVDVYTLTFFCDFINFVIVVIAGAEFALDLGKGEILQYIKYSTVPLPYVTVLMLQFLLIIMDRYLYLRKLLCGKIVLQIALTIIVHIWLFFILPSVSGRQIKNLLAPQIWYMVKCIYFLLSAYQIRNGYPAHNVGNFLCKHYSVVNLFAVNGFLFIPFVFEMRCIMDWMWTDTSMTMWEWLKVEEIFVYTFLVKCYRKWEEDYPQASGVKMGVGFKYLMGGFLFSVIACLIWFPLLFFSLGSEVGKNNIPVKVYVKLEINDYEPFYEMEKSHLINSMNLEHWDLMETAYIKNSAAMKVLKSYDHTDVARLIMNEASRKYWDISEVALESLRTDLYFESVMIRFSWVITPRAPYTTITQATGRREYSIPVLSSERRRHPIRQQLLNILNNETSDNTVTLPYIMPKFLMIKQHGEAKPTAEFMDRIVYGEENTYRSVNLILKKSKAGQLWWEIHEPCDDYNYEMYLKIISTANCKKLEIFTFSDRIFPEALSVFISIGIIGLYFGYVYLTYKVVRSVVTSAFQNIMYLDTPNVDPVLQLCDDLYLVREHRLYDLEELLYAKLIFLFRSPETRIRITYYPTQRPLQQVENMEQQTTDQAT